MMNRNINKLASYALMLLVLLSLCYAKFHKEMKTIIAEPRKSISTLYYNGIVSPIAIHNIISSVDGYVLKRSFEYGQYVKKGDLLFEINSPDLDRQFHTAIIEYLRAKSNYKNIAFQSRGITKLYDMGLVSRVAYLDQVSRLQHSELDVFQTEKKINEFLSQIGQTGLDIESLTMEKSEKVYDILKTSLSKININAPEDGFILFSSSTLIGGETGHGKLNPGSAVKAGQSLAIIGDTSGIAFDIDVNEANFNDIKIGQAARITSSSFKGLVLNGKVISISHQANPEAGAMQTYAVRIVVPLLTKTERKDIQIGMSAEVALLSEEPPTIMVPVESLYKYGGRYWLYVIDKRDNTIKPVPVLTGKTTYDSIQILSGLTAGDEVVISY